MAQSPEYPDLAWMPPASWTDANRTVVQLIVIHTTEGGARGTAAEDGAAYDRRREDGTSTHYFTDNNSTVQCVRTTDQAHAARAQGNRRGIQYELCTKSGSATWGDAYHQAMLRLVAKQAARDAKKWGIPVRHCSAAEVADGLKGFCGHADITKAFPQDKGTHTDPGTGFPWSLFLDMVRAELNQEDDMDLTKANLDAIRDAVWGAPMPVPRTTDPNDRKPASDYQAWSPSYGQIDDLAAMVTQMMMTLNAFIASEATDDAARARALTALGDAIKAAGPTIAALVVASLPKGSDQISQAEVNQAVESAFRNAFTAGA